MPSAPKTQVFTTWSERGAPRAKRESGQEEDLEEHRKKLPAIEFLGPASRGRHNHMYWHVQLAGRLGDWGQRPFGGDYPSGKS